MLPHSNQTPTQHINTMCVPWRLLQRCSKTEDAMNDMLLGCPMYTRHQCEVAVTPNEQNHDSCAAGANTGISATISRAWTWARTQPPSPLDHNLPKSQTRNKTSTNYCTRVNVWPQWNTYIQETLSGRILILAMVIMLPHWTNCFSICSSPLESHDVKLSETIRGGTAWIMD